nr:MAG TPA: hypothetical protein [Caudoviricetes sp.]
MEIPFFIEISHKKVMFLSIYCFRLEFHIFSK